MAAKKLEFASLTLNDVAVYVKELETKYDKLLMQVEQLREQSLQKRILVEDPDYTSYSIHDLAEIVQQLQQSNTQLQQQIERLQQTFLGKSLYVVWGKKNCTENTAELVYSGFVGGSYFDHTGAATNNLCLPPDHLNLTTWIGTDGAYIYGAEYQMSGNILDDDAPCAVCRSQTYTNTLMIPARSNCYNGWEVVYRGDLVAGAYSHKAASEYICLHENAETVNSSDRSENGKLLYYVKTVCGSLPCPPYKNNMHVKCVVCGKKD